MKGLLVKTLILLCLLFFLFSLSFAEEPYILFDKSTYWFFVKKGEKVLFKTMAGYGLPGHHPKEKRGDFLTPEGVYQIVSVKPSEQYVYFAEIDYPNLNDLALAYFGGKITFDDLKSYLENLKADSRVKRSLGNSIGIHGGGSFRWQGGKMDFNWTQGCLALDNDDLKVVLPYLKPGTKVYIVNSSNSLFELVRKLSYPRMVKPLDFWEGGLYLNKDQMTMLSLMIKESADGRRWLLYEEWVDGKLTKRVESGVDGKLPLTLEYKLKEELIKHIHTIKDPYPERVVEAWK